MTSSEAEAPAKAKVPRRMWLEGGSSTARWELGVIGQAMTWLGAGMVSAIVVNEVVGGAAGRLMLGLVLWLAMLLAVMSAFRRSVPRGLLRFRATDLLFAVVVGSTLRLVAGFLESAATGGREWPAYETGNEWWWLGDIVGPLLVAPLVEEFFFHGLLLVAIYTVLRRAARSHVRPGAAAALLTTALFVVSHQITGSSVDSWAGPATLALVGLTGAVLVLTTGRIWGAVLAHLVFNGSYVAMGIVGTVWGTGAGVAGLA